MYAIAIHAGAESIEPGTLTPEQEQAYLNGLKQAVEVGKAVLARGGTALDAVEQAVQSMENNELFNAGKGAVFTKSQTHQLDASIMCGQTLQAGVVAGVVNVRNPIHLARTVMEQSEHVFLAGAGAIDFAREQGLAFEPDAYFDTEQRYTEFEEAREQVLEAPTKDTVGAVALDSHGNLAAATSTGGTTFERAGRVGDTAVIGAGTYANNQTCAVSCTGDGEYFIRAVAAHDVSCLVDYKGLSLGDACRTVLADKLTPLGADAGIIAVNTSGQIEQVFNTPSMFRAWRNDQGEGGTFIFK